MAIKATPDIDGMIRFEAHGKAFEVATRHARTGTPAPKPASSPAPSPPLSTKQGRDWRRGWPAFHVPGKLDDSEVTQILQGLDLGEQAADGATLPIVVVKGVEEFDPASLARLSEEIGKRFDNAMLMLDLEDDPD
ncbi:hypothetical protein E5A73_02670 [Sphingomonas gei]|uniref:Uncharacterized protein n=1 Tax=Sphingomonas gei TaxID=1395960 RepID=A0A4V3QZY1_9SPHN|nr:hypothetical protein [Sphingomonas gei]TGX56032.1 hypothetical protein E5A73_02670 [Sphingomonas gei]